MLKETDFKKAISYIKSHVRGNDSGKAVTVTKHKSFSEDTPHRDIWKKILVRRRKTIKVNSMKYDKSTPNTI